MKRKDAPWKSMVTRRGILTKSELPIDEYDSDEFEGSALVDSLDEDSDDHISSWVERSTVSGFRNKANWNTFVQGNRSPFFTRGYHSNPKVSDDDE